MRRAHVPIAATFEGFGERPNFAAIVPLARLLTDDYIAGTYTEIDLIYPRFVSTLVQRPVVDRLLPVEPSDSAAEGIPGGQFIFEPSPDAVLRQLMPRYVATRVYQAAARARRERAISAYGGHEERHRERPGTDRRSDA